MLGYTAAEVMERSHRGHSDPQEVASPQGAERGVGHAIMPALGPGFKGRGNRGHYQGDTARTAPLPRDRLGDRLREPKGGLSAIADRTTTARKRAEEELSNGALQSAISTATLSALRQREGVIQIFNVGAEEYAGYTAAEVRTSYSGGHSDRRK